ncbi:MAG: hypothetical protein HQL68_05540 [Magnetococcales bacterium]|nr:hypothetical protein [Magnetococcales bacterium]
MKQKQKDMPMTLSSSTNPLHTMSVEEIDNLFENVSVSQTWQWKESTFADTGQGKDYLDETEIGARNFLRNSADYHVIPKKLLRRSKTALSEIMSNVDKHLKGGRKFISITIGYIPYEDKPAIIICLKNSANERHYKRCKEAIKQSRKAIENSKEELNALSDRLMENPNPGGLGFWNLITQIRAEVACDYNAERDILRTTCLLRG